MKRAVTIKIGFCAWSQHLDQTPLQRSHIVAGPLFDIKAEQGAVAVVYLPHFVNPKGNQSGSGEGLGERLGSPIHEFKG